MLYFFFIFLGAVTSSTASNAAAAATATQAVAEQRNEQRPQENEWHEFTIPPLWKRIVAEIIDFFILFVLKLVVTYIAVDWFSLIDVDRYLQAVETKKCRMQKLKYVQQNSFFNSHYSRIFSA